MIQIDMDMPKNCGECFVGNRTICHNGCPLKEVRHGKWQIEISNDGHQATYQCSECGHQFKWIYDPNFPPVFNYCMKCGADMRTDE